MISSDMPFLVASRALCKRCAAGGKRSLKKSTSVGVCGIGASRETVPSLRADEEVADAAARRALSGSAPRARPPSGMSARRLDSGRPAASSVFSVCSSRASARASWSIRATAAAPPRLAMNAPAIDLKRHGHDWLLITARGAPPPLAWHGLSLVPRPRA